MIYSYSMVYTKWMHQREKNCIKIKYEYAAVYMYKHLCFTLWPSVFGGALLSIILDIKD